MNQEVLSVIINILSSLIYDGMRFGVSHIFPNVKGKCRNFNGVNY